MHRLQVAANIHIGTFLYSLFLAKKIDWMILTVHAVPTNSFNYHWGLWHPRYPKQDTVPPCGLAGRYQRFGRTCCLCRQGWVTPTPSLWVPKISHDTVEDRTLELLKELRFLCFPSVAISNFCDKCTASTVTATVAQSFSRTAFKFCIRTYTPPMVSFQVSPRHHSSNITWKSISDRT
jgi:hypothetical protein